MYEGRMMVFTGNAHPQLARDIAEHLQLPLGQAVVSRFSDGEVLVELMDNVRGKDCLLSTLDVYKRQCQNGSSPAGRTQAAS